MKTIYNNDEWKEYHHIKVSNILFFLLVLSLDKRNHENIKEEIIIKHNSGDISFNNILKSDIDISSIVKTCRKLYKQLKQIKERKSIKSSTKKLLTKIDDFVNINVDKENDKYTMLFQKIGANLRENGYIFEDINLLEKFNYIDIGESPVLIIAKITREIIKLLDIESKKNNEKKHKFYIIDALRNIYEIEFFKNRYESFYLLSILSNQVTREKRILNDFKYKKSDIKRLNNFEKYDKGMSSQGINDCIGKGDIFIQNNSDLNNLYYQLIKYITLIQNPGIFTPSDDERFMQLAFTARYNSGCISRQVGAVISGTDGYIRGVGWNDVPEGHASCVYRTPNELLNNSGGSIKFSEYELTNEFSKELKGLSSNAKKQPFCFKDIQNKIEKNNEVTKLMKNSNLNINLESFSFSHKIKKELEEFSFIDKVKKELIKSTVSHSSFKNPTRERALHAEENAFLQVSKSGGQSVIGGTLYTTDSPCQLCAKKQCN